MSCTFYIDKQSLNKAKFIEYTEGLISSGKYGLVRGSVDGKDFLEGSTPSFTLENQGWYLVSGGSRGVLIENKEKELCIQLAALTTYIEWQFAIELVGCGLLSGATCKTTDGQPIFVDHITEDFINAWFNAYWKIGKNEIVDTINNEGTAVLLDDDEIQAELSKTAYKYATQG